MLAQPTDDHVAYYRAALECLRYLEHRTPTGRRFGSEADERWKIFRGDLETVDRIDLLLRDADTQWPHAFSARVVFDLQGVAEDEPFGPEWQGISPMAAEDLWRALTDAFPASADALLDRLAATWELALRRPHLPPITPTTRLVLAGPGAIAAASAPFVSSTGLAWSDQIHVLASVPVERQFASLVAALTNSPAPTCFLSLTDPLPPGLSADRILLSADAAPGTRKRALALGASPA